MTENMTERLGRWKNMTERLGRWKNMTERLGRWKNMTERLGRQNNMIYGTAIEIKCCDDFQHICTLALLMAHGNRLSLSWKTCTALESCWLHTSSII
jgi:hypothetical protein